MQACGLLVTPQTLNAKKNIEKWRETAVIQSLEDRKENVINYTFADSSRHISPTLNFKYCSKLVIGWLAC